MPTRLRSVQAGILEPGGASLPGVQERACLDTGRIGRRPRWLPLLLGFLAASLGLWLIIRPFAPLALFLSVIAGLAITGLSRLTEGGWHLHNPRAGLLRSGVVTQAPQVLDRCRIRWGVVVGSAGDRLLVVPSPWPGTATPLLSPPGRVRPTPVGDEVAAGDVVALHWD
jgi:hypothetical protein